MPKSCAFHMALGQGFSTFCHLQTPEKFQLEVWIPLNLSHSLRTPRGLRPTG